MHVCLSAHTLSAMAGGVTSWLPGPSLGSMLKPSPLYNRLPSDEWASQLVAEDSAMDMGCTTNHSTPSRTPLQDGLSKLSAIASSANVRSAGQLPAGFQPAVQVGAIHYDWHQLLWDVAVWPVCPDTY